LTLDGSGLVVTWKKRRAKATQVFILPCEVTLTCFGPSSSMSMASCECDVTGQRVVLAISCMQRPGMRLITSSLSLLDSIP